jgi:hypothetical protein
MPGLGMLFRAKWNVPPLVLGPRPTPLGVQGMAKPSVVSVTTGHVGLHIHAGDVNAAGRWLHHREAETRCQGASMHWYDIIESTCSIACAPCAELVQ